MKKLLSLVYLCVLLVTTTFPVKADPVRWYLQGVTLTDGGRAIGSFVYDVDIDRFTEVDVVTTTGPQADGAVYRAPNPGSPGNSEFLNVIEDPQAATLVGQNALSLTLAKQMSNDGGTIEINVDGFTFESTCGEDDLGRECGLVNFARGVASGKITSTRPGVEITAGLSGSWFNLETAGQGFFMDVFPTIPLVFFSWFTYDVEGVESDTTAVVGDAGHRWLTAQGVYRGNEAVLDVTLTTGGIFDRPADVTNSTPDSHGRFVLTFNNDCRTGQLEYELFESGLSGTVPMVRLANDNVSLCQHIVENHAPPKPTGSIVYQHLPNGSFTESDIFRINPDGTYPIPLIADGTGNNDPAPSPDGSKVVFMKEFVVHIMDADGSNVTALQPGRFPDFSPDGQTIVYANNGSLQVMSLDGVLGDPPGIEGDMPDWSPDGSRFVYRHDRNIWSATVDGSGAVNLTQTSEGASASSPRWSPDGTTIAFEMCEGAYCNIMLMDADGQNQRYLTNGEVQDFLPDWSPDGNWILFERDVEVEPGVWSFDLWITTPDGVWTMPVTTSGKASTGKWGIAPP